MTGLIRSDLEVREELLLKPWGFPVKASRGRDHGGEPDPFRTDFQRDHDRLIHSKAFRRLQNKTQVFTDEGDHFRTRLTHSLEVVQIARVAGRRLGLNTDLIECIALAHDLGHPPFGHRGEAMLAELMADHGGFEHNRQALRIVEDLEIRYPEHPGLNLTYEVREAIVKHGAVHDPGRIPRRFRPEEGALLEAQLVDAVDSIAYDCHDLDDGIRGGYLALSNLQEVPLWQAAWHEATEASPRSAAEKLLIARAVRILLDSLVSDLVETTLATLERQDISSIAAVRAASTPLVAESPSLRDAKQTLEAWLFAKLYRHWQVNRTMHRCRRILRELFDFFIAHPDTLPPDHAARAEGMGLHRATADYIAGMTDRFACDEHRRLCG
ncbi:deoxyguanosinetriphosphate triphosphohydrolase-like protein [Planctomycetota bacterium]|nr:deoxyguanosinetriphosphate triphosphohydrolase-like protein [Planctomycetota bacterium]